jgi:hypothetical protein
VSQSRFDSRNRISSRFAAAGIPMWSNCTPRA